MLPLGAVSLTLSVLTTASSGPYAYFGVHTRAWELAAGGAVALARGYLYRLSTAGAAFLGWAGLALLGASAVLVDGSLHLIGGGGGAPEESGRELGHGGPPPWSVIVVHGSATDSHRRATLVRTCRRTEAVDR